LAHEAASLAEKPEAEKVFILINGCSAACGTMPPEHRGENCLVVSGSLLGGRESQEGREGKEAELAEFIIDELKKNFL
jgi:hypothetical protein